MEKRFLLRIYTPPAIGRGSPHQRSKPLQDVADIRSLPQLVGLYEKQVTIEILENKEG